jgi:hypothetical protein
MNSKTPIEIREQVKRLLSNKDLEIEFQDSIGMYSITYSTNILAQESHDLTQLTRNYWLIQKNGTQISSPWGFFDLDKQISLASNLIIYSKYTIKSVASGWQVNCKNCNSKQSGPIWRNSLKSCEKCGYQYETSDRSMVLGNI